MQRLRLLDIRQSDFPQTVGLCQSDTARIANLANRCETRLMTCREAGDEGWWGSWAEMVFNVSAANPYITPPRGVARLEYATACNRPVPIQNQFFEYLAFGNGKMPQNNVCGWARRQVYERNNVPTFVDLTSAPQIIRVRCTDPADQDGNHRVLLQGADITGTIFVQDTFDLCQGIFVTLDTNFVDAPMQFQTLTGIQKDVTSGFVSVYQVDPTSGAEVLLVTMEPSETTAWYRRYFLDGLPNGCCPGPTSGTVQVTALAKLDHVDARVDTDYFVLQNLEAFIEEGQSIRYSKMDTPAAKGMSQERHLAAVRFLQGELVHHEGKQNPAVIFAPFGTAHLAKQRIGLMI